MACRLIYELSGSYLALTSVTGGFQDERVIFLKGERFFLPATPSVRTAGIFNAFIPSEFPRTPYAGSPLSEKDLFSDSR